MMLVIDKLFRAPPKWTSFVITPKLFVKLEYEIVATIPAPSA